MSMIHEDIESTHSTLRMYYDFMSMWERERELRKETRGRAPALSGPLRPGMRWTRTAVYAALLLMWSCLMMLLHELQLWVIY